METPTLIKFIKRECTPEEAAKVSDWIDKCAENRARYQELQVLWAAGEMTEAAETQSADKQSVGKIMRIIRQKKYNRIYKTTLIPFSIAAAVALLLVLLRISPIENNDLNNIDYQNVLSSVAHSDDIRISLNNGETISLADTSVVINSGEKGELIINNDTVYISPATEPVLQTVHVPYGKLSKIILSDGSIVHLNSGSSFVYPSSFHHQYREVYIEGEAFFEVAKDEVKPFVVKTPFKTVEVLGTSFNILADQETSCFETVLVAGSVAIKGEKGETEMMPGQLYRYNAGTETIKTVDVYPFIAWTKRRMLFEREPLGNVLRKLEKVYNVKINISAQNLSSHEISGDLNLKDSAEETMNVIMQLLIPNYFQQDQKQYELQ